MMTETTPLERFGTVARVMKTIAHPERLAIIEHLRKQELSVNQVAELIGAKQSITSHHLNLMRANGVLYDRREGVKVFYGIENKAVIKLLDCIYQNCENARETQ
jgi:DNA-binding transcriptional ArsR family regulator